MSKMTITEIEAELYRLQSHTCDGRLTLNPDGSRDPGDHGCRGCARTLELHAMLAAGAAGEEAT